MVIQEEKMLYEVLSKDGTCIEIRYENEGHCYTTSRTFSTTEIPLLFKHFKIIDRSVSSTMRRHLS